MRTASVLVPPTSIPMCMSLLGFEVVGVAAGQRTGCGTGEASGMRVVASPMPRTRPSLPAAT